MAGADELCDTPPAGRGCENRRPPAVAPAARDRRLGGFRHESLFYATDAEFLSGTLPAIVDAVELGRPVLVAVAPLRISLLREALGERAAEVRFADMCALGRNPARIIPAWHEFLEQSATRGEVALGIAEPVWPGRSRAQIEECERHEWLLNLAFAGGRAWRLLCPYDAARLEERVIASARRNHPHQAIAGAGEAGELYASQPEQGQQPDWLGRAFSGALPEPRGPVQELAFDREQLRAVRALVAERAGAASLPAERVQHVVLAVSELSTNSVRHGGGAGRVRVWCEPAAFLCEVSDRGRIELPLAGRASPRPSQLTGRGLWLVNQLCDLVQIRSDRARTVVRVHMELASGA